jgi:hypothetical protein
MKDWTGHTVGHQRQAVGGMAGELGLLQDRLDFLQRAEQRFKELMQDPSSTRQDREHLEDLLSMIIREQKEVIRKIHDRHDESQD